MPRDLSTSIFFPLDHQNRLETETHWFQLTSLRNGVHGWLGHFFFCTKNFLEWKWLHSSGRAFKCRRPVPKSPRCEGWVLPSMFFFNKHPHTWPFPQATLSEPSQHQPLSSLGWLTRTQRQPAVQSQVDLGRAPQPLILFVKVETLQHRFLHLASLLRFLGHEAWTTSG